MAVRRGTREPRPSVIPCVPWSPNKQDRITCDHTAPLPRMVTTSQRVFQLFCTITITPLIARAGRSSLSPWGRSGALRRTAKGALGLRPAPCSPPACSWGGKRRVVVQRIALALLRFRALRSARLHRPIQSVNQPLVALYRLPLRCCHPHHVTPVLTSSVTPSSTSATFHGSHRCTRSACAPPCSTRCVSAVCCRWASVCTRASVS